MTARQLDGLRGRHGESLPPRQPLPEARARRGRRRLELKGEAHAPQKGRVEFVDAVGRPQHRHAILFEQPIEEHLRAGAANVPAARADAIAALQHIFHLVEQQ
jgi:hypothetical protein